MLQTEDSEQKPNPLIKITDYWKTTRPEDRSDRTERY